MPFSPSPDDEIYGLARATIDAHVAAIDEARQAKDDGATGHASVWKAAKKAGLPVDPLKLCLKLERMAESKRRDYLRGFDALRISYFGWDDQLDMFEAPRPAVELVEVERADAGEVESEAGPAEEAAETIPAAEEIPPADIGAAMDAALAKVQAVEQPGPAPETDPEADHAGTAFNAGRMAALGGLCGEQNPYKRNTLRGKVWAQGHAKGLAERDGVGEDAAPSNVVALPGSAPAALVQPGAA